MMSASNEKLETKQDADEPEYRFCKPNELFPKPTGNPNAILVIEECPCCDGRGRDWTAEDGSDICEVCDGKGKVAIERDYLAEAFKIAQGGWYRPIEREHVTAVIQHCRKMVGAAMELPEVA